VIWRHAVILGQSTDVGIASEPSSGRPLSASNSVVDLIDAKVDDASDHDGYPAGVQQR
jgi:hypothetical protein